MHAVKECGVMEVELICSLGARWVGWSASRYGLFTRGKSSVTHYTQEACVWGRGPVWTLMKSNPLTFAENRTTLVGYSARSLVLTPSMRTQLLLSCR